MAKSLKDYKNTILIADDNITRRNNMSSRLRLQGYETELSTGGFHAIHLLEQAKKNGFCYRVFMIVQDMFDMAGKEILFLARDIETREKMPVLFIAETNDAEEVLELMQAGANEYLAEVDNFKSTLDKVKKLAPLKK